MKSFVLSIVLLVSLGLWGDGETDYKEMRHRMVEEQIRQRGIIDPNILQAFRTVKRHLFVQTDLRHLAYSETQLPLAEGQIMSRPYFMAIMTRALGPAEDKKILDIGTGSGYLACLLSRMVKEVYTVEVKESLSLRARDLAGTLGYTNIHFRIGDGYVGWEEHAPFDGIIITCPDDHIPQPLIDQLAVGGRMVIPVSYSQVVQELVLITKKKDGSLKKINILPVPDRFKPIIRKSPDHEQ